jgi:AAA-like domain
MKKILFLAANPKGTSPLRLEQEARDISDELRRAHQGDQFQLEQRWAVRSRDIQQAMLDVCPQIVHFSGHGKGSKIALPSQGDSSDSICRSAQTLERKLEERKLESFPEDFPRIGEEGLVFEDAMEQEKLVTGGALAGLFELFTDEVECVILNGCYSETQARAIAEYVPYVIGMNDAISDKAAIEFSVGFYKALGAGRPIDFAYKLGCNAIQIEGIPGHLIPHLISKSKQLGTPTNQSSVALEFPSGPVSLESMFYVERLPNETRHYQSILKPGSLLRITAPDLMGKTSLMSRILNHADQHDCQSIYLNLRDAGHRVLTDLNSFLYWFCERISSESGLENQLEQRWDDKTLGCISNCTDYFEKYILSQLSQPLVLGVDEVDRVFPYSDLATDFFGMLRNWFEKGKTHPTWKKLRLVLAYSTEDYSQFRINQSPFNVGQPLKLRELNPQQVQDLADRYGLNWTSKQMENLMAMVGGHPYLIHLAMYYVGNQEETLEQLLEEAPTEEGIYSDHLIRYWNTLSNHPSLAEAIKTVMKADKPVHVERSIGYQLHSMGLIQYEGSNVVPACKLYRLYFGA